MILILSVISKSVFAFDDKKNGWYINTELGFETTYIEERIYDQTIQKTVSKSSNKSGFLLDIGFGYIFEN